MTALTRRYADAVNYARIAHASQQRKGSGIPYLYHLLAVSSLMLEFGGIEDQVIGGLLHDVLEDCGGGHIDMIRAEFGDAVAQLVLACTDGDAESKAGHQDAESKRAHWRRRKRRYLEHLRHVPETALLVSACDKLHDARAVLSDLEDPAVGIGVFERFTGGVDGRCSTTTRWPRCSPAATRGRRDRSRRRSTGCTSLSREVAGWAAAEGPQSGPRRRCAFATSCRRRWQRRALSHPNGELCVTLRSQLALS